MILVSAPKGVSSPENLCNSPVPCFCFVRLHYELEMCSAALATGRRWHVWEVLLQKEPFWCEEQNPGNSWALPPLPSAPKSMPGWRMEPGRVKSRSRPTHPGAVGSRRAGTAEGGRLKNKFQLPSNRRALAPRCSLFERKQAVKCFLNKQLQQFHRIFQSVPADYGTLLGSAGGAGGAALRTRGPKGILHCKKPTPISSSSIDEFPFLRLCLCRWHPPCRGGCRGSDTPAHRTGGGGPAEEAKTQGGDWEFTGCEAGTSAPPCSLRRVTKQGREQRETGSGQAGA